MMSVRWIHSNFTNADRYCELRPAPVVSTLYALSPVDRQTIFVEGDPDDAMFFIRSGAVRIEKGDRFARILTPSDV